MYMVKAFLPLLKMAAKENVAAPLGSGKTALIKKSTLLGSIARNHDSFGWVPVLSYRCSKAALNMLTNCQAYGYKPDGILCIAIHRGWVNTDLGRADADMMVEDSTKGILNVLCTLTEKQNGLLVDWKGGIVPW